MEEFNNKVTSDHPVGSLSRVFWEQQLKAVSCNDQRQMRWQPSHSEMVLVSASPIELFIQDIA